MASNARIYALLGCVVLSITSSQVLAQLSASYQQGVDGYTGVVDTEFRAHPPGNTSQGAKNFISIDGDDNGYKTQGALKFNNIFQSEGGLVPPNVIISYAAVTLYVNNSADPETTISLNRVLGPDTDRRSGSGPWTDSDTWFSLGGGFIPDENEELHPDAVRMDDIESQIVPDAVVSDPTEKDVFIDIDVRDSVLAWYNGAPNLGWAINNNTGAGWDFWSSEYQLLDQRPKLTISWVLEPGDINLDTKVDLEDYALLLQNMGIQLDGPIEPGAPGDLDFDKDVDLDDFALFKGYYANFPGNNLSALSLAVPEPSTALLLLTCLGSAACMRRRKK